MAWKGWAEGEVRRQSSAAAVTGGFTSSTASVSTAYVSTLTTGHDSLTPDGGPGVFDRKKSGGKGRKRANTTSMGFIAKRVITENVKSATTKAQAKQSACKDPKQPIFKRTISRSTKGTASRWKPVNARPQPNDTSSAPSSNTVIMSAKTVQQVAPLTSMDVLSKTGQSATLYAGPDGPDKPEYAAISGWSTLILSTHQSNKADTTMPPALLPHRGDRFNLISDVAADDFEFSGEETAAVTPSPLKMLSTTCSLPDAPEDELFTEPQPRLVVSKAQSGSLLTEEEFVVSEDLDAVTPQYRSRSPTPQPRDRKLNTRDVHEEEDYGGALLSDSERKLLLALEATKQNAVKTIVRRAFPSSVLDRSPIFGASNSSMLRTCFRTGEALNVGCQAVRENKHLLVELYARVMRSWREERPSRRQHFVLHDLYHDNPPHLHGTFDLWDQSQLWDADSKPFLNTQGDGIMCRLIGRIRRDRTKANLEILNIWEATHEDVDNVADIYAKPGTEPWSKYVD